LSRFCEFLPSLSYQLCLPAGAPCTWRLRGSLENRAEGHRGFAPYVYRPRDLGPRPLSPGSSNQALGARGAQSGRPKRGPGFYCPVGADVANSGWEYFVGSCDLLTLAPSSMQASDWPQCLLTGAILR